MAKDKSATGTESEMDAVRVVIDKALGFPKAGQHVGSGIHVPMPQTWDGQGPTPPGWTKSASSVWVASATDAAIPLSDALAAELQGAPAQARLTGSERATLATAIAGRSQVELDGRTPKASAAQGAAGKAGQDG
jgi:hypothetical protein